ncbi:zinc-finger of the FCS-type, C2-C2 [Orobanche gracilis]
MLRNKPRAVTTKQALMADHQPSLLLSPTTKNPSSPISSFLNSPRFFNGFLSKNLFSDKETNKNNNIMSPTSILDTNTNTNTSSYVNPFGYDSILSKSPNPNPKNNSSAKQDTRAIGLALIDTIIEGTESCEVELPRFSKPINRTSLYGSKLNGPARGMKVQIPAVTNPTTSIFPNEESPKSPSDFGIKTGNNPQVPSPCSSTQVKGDFTRQLSLKEMELSEDYTCVITHGPNPKTTHIFDDCIVGRCSGDHDDDDSRNYEIKKMDCGFENKVSTYPSEDFLSFCYTCKDILGQGKDIYIYREVRKPFAAMNAGAKKYFLKE